MKTDTDNNSPPDWAACEVALQALTESGAHTTRPVAFHALKALLDRARQQSLAVQWRLLPRWWASCRALEAQAPCPPAPSGVARTQGEGELTTRPLRQLLAALTGSLADQAHPPTTPVPQTPLPGGLGAGPVEIRAVREHRQTWSSLSVERQLQRALAQAPEQAGPMNSHALVLQALARMDRLAPAYLQAFVAYVEGMVYLDQVSPGEGRAALGGRASPASRGARTPALPKIPRGPTTSAGRRRPPKSARG